MVPARPWHDHGEVHFEAVVPRVAYVWLIEKKNISLDTPTVGRAWFWASESYLHFVFGNEEIAVEIYKLFLHIPDEQALVAA